MLMCASPSSLGQSPVVAHVTCIPLNARSDLEARGDVSALDISPATEGISFDTMNRHPRGGRHEDDAPIAVIPKNESGKTGLSKEENTVAFPSGAIPWVPPWVQEIDK